jgi:hypothetical protein
MNILRQIRILEARLTDGKTDEPEEKDYKRLEDIVTKSKGSEDKILQLCRQMAKSIKDDLKAKRRAEAAKEVLPPSVALKAYQIFMNYGKVASDVYSGQDYEEIYGIVRGHLESPKFKNIMNGIKKDILKEIKQKLEIESHEEVRRDHDGVSQLNFLIEKMIGEFLSEGKAEW